MGRSMGLFAVASLPAFAALAAGAAVGPSARPWLWALATILDLAAGVVASRARWRVHVSHFAERHGLFVIIVLGESLIAIGLASAELDTSVGSQFAKAAGVALVGVLWWLYFGWFKEWLEERVERSEGIGLLRNSYSFAHFAIVAGVVGVAAALEEVVAHPGDALGAPAALALVVGMAAYLGSVAVLALTAGGMVLRTRLLVTAVLLALVGAVVGIVEHRRLGVLRAEAV